MSDVTRILSQIESGDPSAAEQLLPLVYEELRKLAAAKLAQEKPGQTLQATALVHEAYVRLVGDGPQPGGTGEDTSSLPLRKRCGGSSSNRHVARSVSSMAARCSVSNCPIWLIRPETSMSESSKWTRRSRGWRAKIRWPPRSSICTILLGCRWKMSPSCWGCREQPLIDNGLTPGRG